jgi:iron complex outermembrane receptor protein
VHSFTTVDLAVRYAATRQFSAQLSILNVFNSMPPRDWATYGGSGAPYNPALHLSGAIGRFFTLGASYAF